MQAATQLLKRVVSRLLSDVVQSSGPWGFLSRLAPLPWPGLFQNPARPN